MLSSLCSEEVLPLGVAPVPPGLEEETTTVPWLAPDLRDLAVVAGGTEVGFLEAGMDSTGLWVR